MRLVILCSALLMSVIAVVGGEGDAGKYAHITQDQVELDLGSGRIIFNDEPVDIETYAQRLKSSYSVSLNVWILDRHHEVDLFGSNDSKEQPAVSVEPPRIKYLIKLLEPLDNLGMDPRLVQVGMHVTPNADWAVTNQVAVTHDKAVLLNGEPIMPEDLKKMEFTDCFVGLTYRAPGGASFVDYRFLLKLCRALGPDVRIGALSVLDSSQIRIKAKIYQVLDDGSEDVLSAPMVTTRSGSHAMIRAVENASGMNPYRVKNDQYHQEDLANLGVRFSVMPQVIGDYIRVSGTAVLTKSEGKSLAFVHRDVPVFSYSATKVVVPFSVVLPSGTESTDFEIADVDGEKTRCELSAIMVDRFGISRKE